MSLKELTIYQKHYDLVLYAMPIIGRMPKSQRYILGQQMENLLLSIARNILRANRQKGKYRLGIQYEIDEQLEEFKLLARIAKDLNMLLLKHYEQIAEKTVEIGKLLGGWIKSSQ